MITKETNKVITENYLKHLNKRMDSAYDRWFKCRLRNKAAFEIYINYKNTIEVLCNSSTQMIESV